MKTWYILELIKNSNYIRNRVSDMVYIDDAVSHDYSNLISLEGVLDNLIAKKIVSKDQILCIKMLSNGFTLTDISAKVQYNRMTVVRIIEDALDKLSYFLGYEFSDDGFLEYMAEKYNLNKKQIVLGKVFMNKRRL